MCHASCIEFIRRHVSSIDVAGREVLEVGARNVNGSVRELVCTLQPRRYVGVDLEPGPGVDEICDAKELVSRFGPSTFDVVISTEMLEHVRDWHTVVTQFKAVLRPAGLLFLTTRSRGFPYHPFPEDFWRFELSDMEEIFSDCDREVLETDPSMPGVFLRARKPNEARPAPEATALFSMIVSQRAMKVTDAQIAFFRARTRCRQLLRAPEKLVRQIRRRLQEPEA